MLNTLQHMITHASILGAHDPCGDRDYSEAAQYYNKISEYLPSNSFCFWGDNDKEMIQLLFASDYDCINSDVLPVVKGYTEYQYNIWLWCCMYSIVIQSLCLQEVCTYPSGPQLSCSGGSCRQLGCASTSSLPSSHPHTQHALPPGKMVPWDVAVGD